MAGFSQSDDPVSAVDAGPESAGRNVSLASHAGQPDASRALNEPELEAALQLLVERAQYITGATGTALALLKGDEMVCRASTGILCTSGWGAAPGASGLTGESIASRRMLRCENAESDPRVNLQACRTLGIASIVVLPLLRPNGDLLGLFELFSDHAYAFEERDLIALERMADLTLTALGLAEQRHEGVPPHPEIGQAPIQTPTPASEIMSPAEKVADIPLAADVPFVSEETTASTMPSAMKAEEPTTAISVLVPLLRLSSKRWPNHRRRQPPKRLLGRRLRHLHRFRQRLIPFRNPQPVDFRSPKAGPCASTAKRNRP